MKQLKSLSLFAMAALLFSACQKENRLEGLSDANLESKNFRGSEVNFGRKEGHVYTLTNESSGNKVLDFKRGSDGSLTFSAMYETGGNGTGSGLGNQGALVISDDERFLLGVNAGSNSISSFKIQNDKLKLVSTVSSGGTQPISITQSGGLVYVVNAGSNGNISGFQLSEGGNLEPILNSSRPLSSSSAGPAQISFVRDGRVVVVTEKNNNKIISYQINDQGVPGDFHQLNAANNTPFGFATGKGGNIFVSEAAGGAVGGSTVSSYVVDENGAISLAVGPIHTGQSSACWVARTRDGRYSYTTNTASNTVSSLSSANASSLSLILGNAASTGTTPVDASINSSSSFLYVLNSGSHSISAFNIHDDGSLTSFQTLQNLPVSLNGLAAD